MDVQNPMRSPARRLLRAAAVAVGVVAVAVGTVDTAAAYDTPHVTINTPLNSSVNQPTPAFVGYGDPLPEGGGMVTLTIHEGSSAGGRVVEGPLTTLPLEWTESTQGPEFWEGPGIYGTDGGTWSLTLPEPLPGGTYTAVATQENEGHEKSEASVTFTVVGSSPPPVVTGPTVPTPAGPSGPPPPAASFSWFPSSPEIGQSVSLVSTSTDTASPITAFAWALTGDGAFQAGGQLLTTSFSTPGSHVVRLRVTDANGLTSVATQTIHVTSAPLTLMQPFPIVRIAGSVTSSGVRLRLLTAQAPVGARVTVSCRGRGCPTKSEGQVALSRKGNPSTVVVEFRRFERFLRAGVILDVWISKPGNIGKFTAFRIRRGKLPVRVDMCLDATGVSPLVCPSS